MIRLLLHWVLVSAMLIVVANIVPGITIANFQVALIAIVVFSLINGFIRPLLILLTLPINFLTLGLFTVVMNAALFVLGANLVQGFEVNGFLAALFGSLLLSITSGLIEAFLKHSSTPKSHFS